MPAAANEIHSTTQTFLDIFDITNDILINKDGSTALILQVNALNFGLLAEEEQDAIMYSYAGLLNSLNYPIQIVIRSQTKDVTNYLNLLAEEEEKAVNPAQKSRINRYRAFVADLIKERNVLDKKFYVAIPASALEMGLLPPSTVLPGVKQPDLTTVERSVILDKAREVLEPKRDHLVSQFARIGLSARQLTTQEIIQLLYVSYNPEAAEGQQISDTSSYTTPLVRASVQGGFMADQTPTATPTSTPAPDMSAPAPVAPTATPEPTAPSAPAMPVPEPSLPTPPAPMTPPAAAPNISESPMTTPVAPPTPPTPMSNPGSITPPTSPAPSATAPAAPMTPPASSPSVIEPAATSLNTPPVPPSINPIGGATQTISAPEQEAQAAIDSTLKQLGGTGDSAPTITAAPSTPGATTPAAPTDTKDELPPVAEI